MKNMMIECSVCHSKLVSPSTKTVSRAYDRHRTKISSKQRALSFLLVGGDCVLVGLQHVELRHKQASTGGGDQVVNCLSLEIRCFGTVLLNGRYGAAWQNGMSDFCPTAMANLRRMVVIATSQDSYSGLWLDFGCCFGDNLNNGTVMEFPSPVFSSNLPILVFMSKVDGHFNFSPISVNFLTEVAKVLFAVVMLMYQARRQKVGEKPLLSVSTFIQAARSNILLAVPALLYAVNNYLKFTMQLYFNPATVKMLSNLKVLVIAALLRIIMKRKFSIIQWEALALLLIGISINQLKSFPDGTTALGIPVTTGAYVYTMIFVSVPSMASVFNEYALKSQYDTSIYLQNLFLYGYGAIFNFLGILGSAIFKGPSSFDILEGHSNATMLLICNNAAQGVLSSFFFKYADTILKKYSSTVATIFTGIASAVLFGHTLTINFMLGISVVFISMHQFFSPLSKAKDDQQNGVIDMVDVQDNNRLKESSFINMAAGANEEASHRVATDERQPLLPT